MKIYIDAELDRFRRKCVKRKNKDWLQFSEVYVVRYLIGGSGFWLPGELVYYASNKRAHTAVEKKWRSDTYDCVVRLISVTYQ